MTDRSSDSYLETTLRDLNASGIRKPNRSRRIVKKLLKRAVRHPIWNMDAVIADGTRVVTAQEIMEHGL